MSVIHVEARPGPEPERPKRGLLDRLFGGSGTSGRMQPNRNEQLKITATWVNTVGAGCIVAGLVAPLANALLDGALKWNVMGSGVIWIGIGGGLHLVARTLAGRVT